MKYKFKIGDEVYVIMRAKVGTEKNYFGKLVGRKFIITKRSNTQGINSYAVSDRESDDSYAWVYEEQMELTTLVKDFELEGYVYRQKQFEIDEELSVIERKQELIKTMSELPPKQQEDMCRIFFPFEYNIIKQIENSLQKPRHIRGKK